MFTLHRPATAVRKVVAPVTLAVALAAGTALPAAAAPPITERFPIEEEFTDEGASAACGFPVTVQLTGFAVLKVSFDEAGEPSSVRLVINATGTISGNGISLSETDHTVIFIDFAEETRSEIGIVFRVSVPGTGVILFDRGRLVFGDFGEGELLFEAGPHPGLHGDIDALCEALTP